MLLLLSLLGDEVIVDLAVKVGMASFVSRRTVVRAKRRLAAEDLAALPAGAFRAVLRFFGPHGRLH
jgi:hypothetical protein